MKKFNWIPLILIYLKSYIVHWCFISTTLPDISGLVNPIYKTILKYIIGLEIWHVKWCIDKKEDFEEEKKARYARWVSFTQKGLRRLQCLLKLQIDKTYYVFWDAEK